MATTSYEAARRLLASLTREEQLRLVDEIASPGNFTPASSSLMELCGLGRDLWNDLDAQEYVAHERSAWNG